MNELENLRAELEEVKEDRSECFRVAMLAQREHSERARTLGRAVRARDELVVAVRALIAEWGDYEHPISRRATALLRLVEAEKNSDLLAAVSEGTPGEAKENAK